MTNLLQRFVDFATGEVTADVNNLKVTTDELFTEPAGCRLGQTSAQTIADSTVTELTWQEATEFNSNAPAFADLTNNQITIPSDNYSFIWIEVQVAVDTTITWDLFDVRKNGGNFDGYPQRVSGPTAQNAHLSAGPIAVSSGDDFTVRMRQKSGNAVDTSGDSVNCWFRVVAV